MSLSDRPQAIPPFSARKPISNLRWWIGGILFASTIINYIDRQTLSLLAPFLKLEYHWTNTDYANLVIGAATTPLAMTSCTSGADATIAGGNSGAIEAAVACGLEGKMAVRIGRAGARRKHY